MNPTTETKWIVECGVGHHPYPEFDNDVDAFTRHREELAIPSYIHRWKLRTSRVIKVTTMYEDVTPKEHTR